MTRELPPDHDPDPDRDPDRQPSSGHIRTTGAGALVGFALTGLVFGWLLRPVSIRITGRAPTVGWLPALELLLVAAILAAVAWSTYRDLHPRNSGSKRGTPHPRRLLEPHKAVNRLVLAKSCALAGSMVAGGYFGYALSWWRVTEAALARQRLGQALLAGVAGVAAVAASLLLERACRVGPGDDTPLP